MNETSNKEREEQTELSCDDCKDQPLHEEAETNSEPTGDQEEATLSDFQKEIESLTNQIAAYKDRELRQRAEFDNFRKRTAKQQAELRKNITSDCIESFLSILDNLERALAAETTAGSLKEGIEMIVHQFKETLKSFDVTEIDALNQPFDPELHHAINKKEDEHYAANTVCEVFQKGYRMKDKIIRHAMVIVANPEM